MEFPDAGQQQAADQHPVAEAAASTSDVSFPEGVSVEDQQRFLELRAKFKQDPGSLNSEETTDYFNKCGDYSVMPAA